MKEKIILIIIILIGLFLRIYKVADDPPGLYIDEVSIGVNAYDILKTGKDEYAVPFPMTFRSFGDYKMPVYIYSVSLSMAVFGKNEFAIRFPSVLAGTFTILFIYLLTKELLSQDNRFTDKKMKRYLPILAAFFLAVSRWHLQFSRAGFEVNMGVMFFVLAVWLSLLWYRQKKLYVLIFAALSFVLTIYTYHIFRVITPIAVTAGVLAALKHKNLRRHVAISFVVFFILCVPLGLFSLTPQGSERLAATYTFADYPKLTSFGQKIVFYPLILLKNYLSFFGTEFLFNNGDGIGRHQVPGFGLIPYWQIPLLLYGLFILLKEKSSRLKYIVLFLFFVSPAAAIVARPSPHTLRDLLFVIPSTIIISLGFYEMLIAKKSIVKLALVSLILLGVFDFASYLRFYYSHYIVTNVIDWGGEYKAVIADLKPYEKTSRIVIDGNIGDIRPYISFYDPSMKYEIVGNDWVRPKDITGPVIYVRPRYDGIDATHLVHTIYIPNVNHDVYAQFFKE